MPRLRLVDYWRHTDGSDLPQYAVRGLAVKPERPPWRLSVSVSPPDTEARLSTGVGISPDAWWLRRSQTRT